MEKLLLRFSTKFQVVSICSHDGWSLWFYQFHVICYYFYFLCSSIFRQVLLFEITTIKEWTTEVKVIKSFYKNGNPTVWECQTRMLQEEIKAVLPYFGRHFGFCQFLLLMGWDNCKNNFPRTLHPSASQPEMARQILQSYAIGVSEVEKCT